MGLIKVSLNWSTIKKRGRNGYKGKRNCWGKLAPETGVQLISPGTYVRYVPDSGELDNLKDVAIKVLKALES